MRALIISITIVSACSEAIEPPSHPRHDHVQADTSQPAESEPESDSPQDSGETTETTETTETAEPTDTALYQKDDSGTDEEPVDCTRISEANPTWEVCEESPSECAGVFGDGAGCQAYCAAADLVCVSRSGGEPDCQEEPENVIDCDASNGHTSDWCTCGIGRNTERKRAHST